MYLTVVITCFRAVAMLHTLDVTVILTVTTWQLLKCVTVTDYQHYTSNCQWLQGCCNMAKTSNIFMHLFNANQLMKCDGVILTGN